MLRVEVQLSFKREGKEFQKVGLKAILVKNIGSFLLGPKKFLFPQSLPFKQKSAFPWDISQQLLFVKRKQSPYLWQMRNWVLSLYYACIPVLPISISRSMLAFNCPLAPYLEIPVTELLWLACSHFFIPLHPLRFLSLFLASPIPIQPRHFTYMVS